MSSTEVEKVETTQAPDVRAAANRSLIQRARTRDVDAMKTMFRQFIPAGENVSTVEYLGSPGLLFKSHSFACVTDRRVASLQVRRFGQIIYQDGLLEALNSAVLYQPSRFAGFFSIMQHSKGKKVGVVLSISEGINVHILSHRKQVTRANGVYRAAVGMRERRLVESPAAPVFAHH
jgi:hypothetical protein